MQTRPQTLAAALMAFAAGVHGHIIMKSPAPFGSVGSTKSITSSPLTSAQFPCQVGADPAKFYSKEGLDNTMEIGKTQTLSFEGSAVHGGGSCQLALTKDPQPSASTSWEVILSIEGGCPSKSGTGVDTYDFTIPDTITPGDYVFAWTWISKLSGTQEYYMNCAPVTVTGGSGKRDVYQNETMELFGRDTALPELMVANLAGINDCKSELSTDPQFPVPGPNVIKPGTNNKFSPISGSNCVPKGAKAAPADGAGPGSDGGSSGSSSAATPTPTTSSSAAVSSVASTFVTVTIDTSTLPAATATSSSAVATTTAFPSPSPASSTPGAGPSGSPTPSGSGGLTGACEAEGTFNCLDGQFYQQCASGSWSVIMQMPPTTKCALGQSMTLWARDLKNKKDTLAGRRRGY